MPLPWFQGAEEEEYGAITGETRGSAEIEGRTRRVEDHPAVQSSVDPQTLLNTHDEPAAPNAVPFQQPQSSAALESQSLDTTQQHSSSSAESQQASAEEQASATAGPFSSGVTVNLSEASSALQSFESLDYQQHLAQTERCPSESSDYHTDMSAEDSLSRSGHNLSTASPETIHWASSSSADGAQSSMAQASLPSTGHQPSAPTQLNSSASSEHQASSSAEEQHPVLPAEQQVTGLPNITLGPQTRRPVAPSQVERGELCVSGENSDAVSRALSDELPESRMDTEGDIGESSQPRDRGSSCPDCNSCETVRSELHADSWRLWCRVPGRCCKKMYPELQKVLRASFAGDKSLCNKCALNLLKHTLSVPLTDDVAEVPVQKFLDAQRFFGPLVASNGKCYFLANVEKLATRSRSGGRNNPRSWFAGRMDSTTAENCLQSKKKGTFLARFSSSSPASEGSFVISVVTETQSGDRSVQHFLVQGNPEATRNDPRSLHLTFQGREFPSLVEAVDHARRFGVTEEGQGRVTFTDICPGLPLQGALTPYR